MRLIYNFNVDLVSQDLSCSNITIKSTDYDGNIEKVLAVVNNLIKLDVDSVKNEYSDFYKLNIIKTELTKDELANLITPGKVQYLDYLGTKERGRYLRIYQPFTLQSTNL